MNYERKVDSMDILTGNTQSIYGQKDAGRSRKTMIIALVLIALALVAAWAAYSSFSNKGTEAAASDNGAIGGDGKGASSPTVTVVVPGRQSVQATVSANGTIAARVEMPVGIAGEGGQVSRVLVQPGQWVKAGQVLAVIDRSVQVQQANALSAQIRVAQADASLAQAELERAEALVSRGFISKADMDRKRSTRDAANARVRVAQAQYAETQARNSRLNIVAPAAGLVLTRQIEPGQVVSAGSGILFRMARGGEMEMMAQMSETDLQRLSVGTKATVTPVGSNLNIDGHVWQKSPVIDPQTRQGNVRIALPYSAALRPGGFADAKLISGTADLPLLPESAVLSNADGNYVYVVGKDNKVERRKIKVGSVSDNGVAIAEGLQGTERVVVLAGAFLNPGDTIKPVLEKAAK